MAGDKALNGKREWTFLQCGIFCSVTQIATTHILVKLDNDNGSAVIKFSFAACGRRGGPFRERENQNRRIEIMVLGISIVENAAHRYAGNAKVISSNRRTSSLSKSTFPGYRFIQGGGKQFK